MSQFVRFSIANFLVFSSIGSTSLLPPYLVSLGASQTFVGVFSVIGTLLIVLTVVFFGRRLVTLPRVTMLRWGYLVTAIAYVLSWVFSGSLGMLLVLRLLGSVSQVFASTLMMSAVFDLSPPDKRAGSLALFSVGGMLTNPVTSVAGEAVVHLWGGPALFLMGAAFALAALAWSMLMHEPPTHLSEGPVASLGSVLRQRDIRPLWVLTFVFGVYYSALVTFLPNHTQLTLGVANLSAFMIPFSLVAIALRLVLGKQLDRRPPRRFLYLSFAAVFAAQVFLFLPASLLTLGLAGFCYGLGHSILYPLLNSLVVNKGGEAHKAVYSNAFVVVNLVSPIIITPLLGALGDVAGFNAILLVLAMAALAGVLLSRRNFPRPSAEPI